jgi:hypothetical protein
MIRRNWWVAIASVMIVLGGVRAASAQRMFLDTNGDGEATAEDGLSSHDVTRVSIWVETNSHGSPGSLIAKGVSEEDLTINSYEFILHSDGGQVRWGKFENAQPTMYVRMGPFSNASDYYIGQMGMECLRAGKYKLGTLEVTAVAGSPSLSFSSGSPVWSAALTSFGSHYPGRDGDNTLKLTTGIGQDSEGAPFGDWSDAVGLAGGPKQSSLGAQSLVAGAIYQFGIRQLKPADGGAPQLIVTTTRPGSMHLRLYNVSGRLVRVIANETSVASGEHSFSVEPRSDMQHRLPSGVYYFTLVTPEGERSGKIVIVR